MATRLTWVDVGFQMDVFPSDAPASEISASAATADVFVAIGIKDVETADDARGRPHDRAHGRGVGVRGHELGRAVARRVSGAHNSTVFHPPLGFNI
jgi:hypothetical protein